MLQGVWGRQSPSEMLQAMHAGASGLPQPFRIRALHCTCVGVTSGKVIEQNSIVTKIPHPNGLRLGLQS